MLLAACGRILFLAVGGATNGLLFLAQRPSRCFWSSLSSKKVARFRAAVLCSKVQNRRSEEERAYSWVGSASFSELPPEDQNSDTLLLSSFWHFAAGMSDRGRGFAKSGSKGTCLLEVLEDAEVPGVDSSSSSWSRR